MAKLELQDVMKAMDTLSLSIAQTRNVAFFLGVPLETLDNIDDERRGSDRTKYYMKAWLDRDTEASWEKLIETLRSQNFNRQAADLEKRFGQFAAAMMPVPESEYYN